MKKINLKRDYLKIIAIIFFVLLGSNYINKQYQASKFNYSRRSNELRKSLNVPIIEVLMNSTNVKGSYWESWCETPWKNRPLHAWKGISPSEDKNFILNEENDAYRKKDSNGRIRQLNIYNKILKDSILIRSGIIFYHDEPREKMELDESDINNIVKKWGLDYLVRE